MINVTESGSGTPDPEVLEKAKRRRFTAAYKAAVLDKFEACGSAGERGALLRREGLYRSHIAKWREQRNAGGVASLEPRKRGRKAREHHPLERELENERRERRRLERKLRQAELIIEIQKKVSQVLGIPLKSIDDEQSE